MAHLASGAHDAEQLVDRDRLEDADLAQPRHHFHRGQRLEPDLRAAFLLDAEAGQRPRRRLEDVPVVHVAVREHVLDVIGQRAQIFWRPTRSMAVADTTSSSSLISCRSVSSTSRSRVLSSDVAAPDLLVDRHVVEDRHHPLADVAVEQVVEIFDGARLRARVAMFDAPSARRRCPSTDRRGRAAGRRGSRRARSSRRARRASSVLGGQASLAEQVVVQRAGIRSSDCPRCRTSASNGFLSKVSSGCSRRRRSIAVTSLKRRKPSRSVERRDQHVHRLLRRDARERRRNVAAHPDVLVLDAEEVRERVDDRLAVADQHVARGALQAPVAQQRHQRRHEQEVRGAERLHAAHRFFRDRGFGSYSSGISSDWNCGSGICRSAFATSRRPLLGPSACSRPGARASASAAALSAARRLCASTTAAVEATFGSRSSRYGRTSSVSSARPSRASATMAAARTSGASSRQVLADVRPPAIGRRRRHLRQRVAARARAPSATRDRAAAA